LKHKSKKMLLKNKNAVIYGATGAVGSAIARAFAQEGARVFVTGLNASKLEELSKEISSAGDKAEFAMVDALDENAVRNHLASIVEKFGSIDISFNATGPQPKDYDNGTNTMELSIDKFMLPLTTIVRSNFITARSAAKHMTQQQSGVILVLTSIPVKGHAPNVSAIGSTFGALEALVRCFATDFGTKGVRVTGLRTAGMIDTRTIQQTFENAGKAMGGIPVEQVIKVMEQKTLMKKYPVVADMVNVAVFLASDNAKTLTAAIVNSSYGQVMD
jgi:NAD(P)-dependent dehydrogenase (short-subunit alcohol dehydrogenase family)